MTGPSNIGKSYLILEFLKHQKLVFSHEFDQIVYATDEETFDDKKKYFSKLKEINSEIEIVAGIPDLTEIGFMFDNESNKLIIYDDLMESVLKRKDVGNLFTVNLNSNLIFMPFLAFTISSISN